MTCIVGIVTKDGVLIAGDSQSSNDWIKRYDKSAKVFDLLETVAVGYCGSGRLGQILQYHMEQLLPPPLGMDEHRWVVREFVPYLRDMTEVHGHLHIHHNVEHFGESAFMLAVRNRLFVVEADFSVNEHVLPYEAIGSGAETAMGVLHGKFKDTKEIKDLSEKELIEIADAAIHAPTEFTLYVGGEVNFVTTVAYTNEEKDLAKEILGL